MTSEDYQKLIEQIKDKKSDQLVAGFIVTGLIFSTLFFLALSSFAHGIFWFLAQLFLSINILQWFFLLHDFGHDHFFEQKKLNVFFGHIASIFTILPFYPWRYIHRTHHLWVGYKDKDPTQNLLTKKDIPLKKAKLINTCWKYWIPICTLSFSFDNFWNIKKLNLMYPEKKNKNYFSIFLPTVIQLYFFISMGPIHYLKVWGLAYLLFLVFCDPLLLSQHSGKKQTLANDQKVTMYPFKDQGDFTRSLRFPSFIEKFVMLGFNHHTLHHYLPTVPGYYLIEMNYNDPTYENWLTWIKSAKKMNGVDLLFPEELITNK